jgi:Icc-related predicted phosphoesterase
MRLLFVSDLHGSTEALNAIKEASYGALIIAGDIQYAECAKEAANLKNSYFIPGNMDTKPILEIMKGISIHSKTIRIGKIKVAGFGFAPISPNNTPGEISEEEIAKGLSRLDVDNNTLLVTHAPPYGILDRAWSGHAGSRSIRDFVLEKKPFMHVFGHIHEESGSVRKGGTYFVKIPPAYSLKGVYLDDESRKHSFARI